MTAPPRARPPGSGPAADDDAIGDDDGEVSPFIFDLSVTSDRIKAFHFRGVCKQGHVPAASSR